ncbi:polyprotein [tropivirus B1]|uniref:Genome polyprotein n=1 Tax=tropivirus B1 TaxID=2116194 RepID=A0A2P1GN58_9PICO|nr:polyprotein [tropivirus B1]AVM87410.1 polyprotein [tropivirus B1]
MVFFFNKTSQTPSNVFDHSFCQCPKETVCLVWQNEGCCHHAVLPKPTFLVRKTKVGYAYTVGGVDFYLQQERKTTKQRFREFVQKWVTSHPYKKIDVFDGPEYQMMKTPGTFGKVLKVVADLVDSTRKHEKKDSESTKTILDEQQVNHVRQQVQNLTQLTSQEVIPPEIFLPESHNSAQNFSQDPPTIPGPAGERFYQIREVNWQVSHTAGTIITRIPFPSQLVRGIEGSFQQQALRHLLMKTDLAIQVQVNSTPFHSGALMVIMAPEGIIGTETTLQGKTLYQSWIFPSQLLNAGVNNTVVLSVPHVGPDASNPWRVHDNWTLYVIVASQLRIGTGGSSTVIVNILAAPVNTKFQGLTAPYAPDANKQIQYQGLKARVVPGVSVFNSVQRGQDTLLSSVASQTPKPTYMGTSTKTFKQILERPTQFVDQTNANGGLLTLTTSDQRGKKLLEIPLAPTAFLGSYLSELSTLYAQWTGQIVLQLITVHSKQHRGKLLVSYTPSDLVPRGMSEAQLSVFAVFDFGQQQTFEFTIPYVSASPWKRNSESDDEKIMETHSGFLTVWVYAPLTAPAGASSTVDVIPLVKAGKDFSLKGIRVNTRATTRPMYNGTETTPPKNVGEDQSGATEHDPTEWKLINTNEEDTDELNVQDFFSRSRFFRRDKTGVREPPKIVRISPQLFEIGNFTKIDEFLRLFTYVRSSVQVNLNIMQYQLSITDAKKQFRTQVDGTLYVYVAPPGSEHYTPDKSEGQHDAPQVRYYYRSLTQFPHLVIPLQRNTTVATFSVPYLSWHNCLPTVYNGVADAVQPDAGSTPSWKRTNVYNLDGGYFFDLIFEYRVPSSVIGNVDPLTIEMELAFPDFEGWLPRPFPAFSLPTAGGVERPPVVPTAALQLEGACEEGSLQMWDCYRGPEELGTWWDYTRITATQRVGYVHWAIANGPRGTGRLAGKQISLVRDGFKARVELQEISGEDYLAVPDTVWDHASKLLGSTFEDYNVLQNCTTFVEMMCSSQGLQVDLHNSGHSIVAMAACAAVGSSLAMASLCYQGNKEPKGPEYHIFDDTKNKIAETCDEVKGLATAAKQLFTPNMQNKLQNVAANLDFASTNVADLSMKMQNFMQAMTQNTIPTLANTFVSKVISALLKVLGYMLLIFSSPTPLTIGAVISLLVADMLANPFAINILQSSTTSLWSKLSTVLAKVMDLPFSWFKEEIVQEQVPVVDILKADPELQSFDTHVREFNNSVTGMKNVEWLITKLKDFIDWFLTRIGKAKKETAEGQLSEKHDVIMKLYALSLELKPGHVDLETLDKHDSLTKQLFSLAMQTKNVSYQTLLKATQQNFAELRRQIVTTMCKSRMEPIVVYLHGEPRCGKTLTSTLVASALCKHFGWDPKTQIYTPPPSADHMDGYCGQKIHIIDDLGQDAEGKDFRDFNQMVSTTHYIPPMAELRQKGTPYTSEIILVSSNFKKTEPNSIRCHQAIDSRLHFKLECSTFGAYSVTGKPGGPLDVAKACKPMQHDNPHPLFKQPAPILYGQAMHMLGRTPNGLVQDLSIVDLVDGVIKEYQRKKNMRSVLDDLMFQGPEIEPTGFTEIEIEKLDKLAEECNQMLGRTQLRVSTDPVLDEMLKTKATLDKISEHVRQTTIFQRLAISLTLLGFLGTAFYFLVSFLKTKKELNTPHEQGPYSGKKVKTTVKAKLPEGKIARATAPTGEVPTYHGYPQTYGKVHKNTFPVVFEYPDGSIGRLSAFGVYDRWYIVNKHALEDSARIWLREVIYKKDDLLTRVLQHEGTDTDLVAVYFSESPQVKDLRYLLPKGDLTTGYPDGLLLHRADTVAIGSASGTPLDVLVRDIRALPSLRVEGEEHTGIVAYRGMFGKGFCGSPVMVADHILGIHFAGQASTTMGYAHRLTQDMFDAPALQGLRFEIGAAEKPVHVPTKTSLQHSPAWGAFPVKKEPSVLRENDERAECKLADQLFAKYDRDVITPWKNLETSRDCLLQRIKSLAPPKFRELSMHEAINGIPGLDGLDMTQSPGYPYVTQGISRKSLFTLTQDGWKAKPELKEAVEKALTTPESFSYVTFLKDELRSLEKVRTANTRVIEGSSLPVIIAMRMVFGDFFAWCHTNNGPILGSAVGCNPDTDWTRFFHDMAEKTYCFDVDYKNFDGTVPSIAFDFLSEVLEELIESPRIKKMIESVKCSTHIWKNTKYQIVGSMPSGCVGTSIFNSLINIMVFQSACLEFPDFNPAETLFLTYGDDLLIGTEVPLKLQEIAAFLHKHTPFKVTPADKGSVFPEETNIYDVSFLKRRFVPDPKLPVYIHPYMDADVCEQAVMWTRGGPFQSLIQSLAELQWHSGPQNYRNWCTRVHDTVVKNEGKCNLYFPPFSFLYERWLRNFQ